MTAPYLEVGRHQQDENNYLLSLPQKHPLVGSYSAFTDVDIVRIGVTKVNLLIRRYIPEHAGVLK